MGASSMLGTKISRTLIKQRCECKDLTADKREKKSGSGDKNLWCFQIFLISREQVLEKTSCDFTGWSSLVLESIAN